MQYYRFVHKHGVSTLELVGLLEGSGENRGTVAQTTQGGSGEETNTSDLNESDPFDDDNVDSEHNAEDEDAEMEDEHDLEAPLFGSDNDTSDEEFMESRRRVTGWNSNVVHIAKQLEKEAVEGVVGGKKASSTGCTDDGGSDENDFVSEYEKSEEDIHTLVDSDNEDSL
ncbi:unnamed protein product [Cuscuta epithymum]|uniref:Uncharacterized protein n=1 Tax=Cuscuta epithymum TaxID=186058 RepID=A0AAV0FPE5_9ASTE|nr:unnamed protein product [Cuscuta epithymum]